MIGAWGRFRARNHGASVPRLLLWEAICWVLYPVLFFFYRFRSYNVRNIPATGPVLLLCNHQSYLDLLMLGPAIGHRHFHGMARKTLFRGRFGGLIRALNAFEVDQEKGDIRAIRTGIERLKNGYLVLIFPEGSRSPDGAVHEFQEGVMLLIRRAKPLVVPAAIEGAFDAWPIGQKVPRLGPRIAIEFGKPIAAEELLELPPDEAMAKLKRTVESLRRGLSKRLKS